MTLPAALSFFLLASAPAAPTPSLRLAQITIRQRVIVRVPTRPTMTPVEWKESKGPRCTSMDLVAGAVVSGRDSVDLILRTGERMRARFRASCPALDFYSGFYLLPTDDRQICADRDSIHARSGGACEIQRLRRLQPVVAQPPHQPPSVTRADTYPRERR